jgi:hypothetical protein
MWFIVKITKESDEVSIVQSFNKFDNCWDEYSQYLRSPYSVQNGFLRMCSASSEAEAVEDIKAKRREDREIAIKEKKSPERVIKEWAKVYGVDMNKAAEFTTEKFRNEKPKDLWASEMSEKLKEIDYKPIQGKVAKHILGGSEYAFVDFRRTISTKDGSSHIMESYKLKNVGGRWLIDEVEIRDAEADLGGAEE